MFGDIKVTSMQANVVEGIRAGMSEPQIRSQFRIGSTTYHGMRHSLRNKGVISPGRQGVAGSVKVLVEQCDYHIEDEPRLARAMVTPTVTSIARSIKSTGRVTGQAPALFVLADALEDAGFGDTQVTKFLRTPCPEKTDELSLRAVVKTWQEARRGRPHRRFETPNFLWVRTVNRIVDCLAG